MKDLDQMARGRVQLSIGQVGRWPQAEHAPRASTKTFLARSARTTQRRAVCEWRGIRRGDPEVLPRWRRPTGRCQRARSAFLEQRNLTTADLAQPSGRQLEVLMKGKHRGRAIVRVGS